MSKKYKGKAAEEENDDENEGDDDPRSFYRHPFYWPMAAWPRGEGGRYAELQEIVIRDHQRQLSQIGRKISSGDYTPQSMVAEAWRFWARVWGDWADFTRIAYGIDVERAKEAPGELSVYTVPAVRGDESPELTFAIESAKLPSKACRLWVNSLKSSDAGFVIDGKNVSFEPTEIRADARGQIDVKVIVTKVAIEGNLFVPGIYTGTLRATPAEKGDAHSRVLGILVLDLVGRGAR